MFAKIARLFKGYGFSRKTHNEWIAFQRLAQESQSAWVRDMEATSKARQLVAIARQRDAIKDEIAKAIRQKKSTSPMYHALRALKVEELKIEGQR